MSGGAAKWIRNSIFQTVAGYLQSIFTSVYSIWRSMATVFPYWIARGELRREVTEAYPDPTSSRTEDDLPPKTRGFLYNDIDKCTGCGDCREVCPVRCIEVEADVGPSSNKKWVSTFNIDFSRCIFCGFCVDVCAPRSLVHTRKYEGAAFYLEDLSAHFGRGEITPLQMEKWRKMKQAEEF